MMKLIMFVIFLIPVSLLDYNLFQFFLFFFSFIMILNCNFSYFWLSLSFIFGMDCLSYYLIILSVWIMGLMMVASYKVFLSKKSWSLFNLSLLFLLLMLMVVFSSMNLIVFYIFFEISFIPLLFLIVGWGYQPERLMAGFYLMFYTLVFSLPMMVGLFFIYNNLGSLMIFELENLSSYFLYFFVVMVFLVKMPMFMIHLWLPKAHVEAPVAGSMILAGIMLKLGGYGMIRFMKLFLTLNLKLNMIIMVFSIMGGFIISILCLFQTDMKSLIAYSSVSHMSLVLAGILTYNYFGFIGGLLMMIAHGLCSSGLFALVNVYYERFNSRSMYMLKGLLNLYPSFALWMFLLSASNMAAPPSLNLLGEIFLLSSLISFSSWFIILLSLLSFFSACYSIYLFSYSQHGKLKSSNFSIYYGNGREFMLMMFHWLPLNLLIIYADSFMI
nr:NADH dehydrogenase subunit 4 [Octodonta nipae]